MSAERPDDRAPLSHPDLRLTETETRFRRFLRIDVIRFRHRLFSGEWSGERTFDVMRRGPAVAIVLYDPERDRVVLIEQFRLPPLFAGCSPWQVEVVAGLVDGDEADEAVARRETREEADLAIIGELVPIQRYMPSPGASDESVMLFCGRVDSSGAEGIHGVADEQEDIRVVVKPLAEIEALLDAGKIENGHSLICIQWLLRHRDRLRRLWEAGASPD
ncbi:MAG: NUDIX domain-containing protein [Alphaproteobacteria bacterium]|nr:NUDIX domain-containing protein [Alphaproteobacteria bacterium]